MSEVIRRPVHPRRTGMSSLAELFERNRKWAARMRQEDPDLFDRLSAEQHPRYLWIGCSDSRVPANQIVDLPPGSVFVHRNIANQVQVMDLNVVAVVQYAVDVLQVKDIIICGHYGCGGIAAALNDVKDGPLALWLRNVRGQYLAHRDEIDALESVAARERRLSELNVLHQVRQIAGCPAVERAWMNGQRMSVHGLIYDVEDGHLHDLGLTVSACL